jgi:hypothetical protein
MFVLSPVFMYAKPEPIHTTQSQTLRSTRLPKKLERNASASTTPKPAHYLLVVVPLLSPPRTLPVLSTLRTNDRTSAIRPGL